ncbi:uncharacterized protein LOC131298542 [Rhododendron vialii]|uniref:uncharacterized protein LOC131298542 n=1 Tax=Rhododendron vialii TaxID=182163 RepID=UPI00265DEB29|nr:uncharacterized protein LOC131298542 [Rhododendron vialii]
MKQGVKLLSVYYGVLCEIFRELDHRDRVIMENTNDIAAYKKSIQRQRTQLQYQLRSNARSWGTTKQSYKCTHCDQTGHTKERCYELVGYPEWWDHSRDSKKRGSGWNAAAALTKGKVDGDNEFAKHATALIATAGNNIGKDIRTRQTIGYSVRRGKLYYLDLVSTSSDKLRKALVADSFEGEKKKSEIWLWHRRLGHVSFGYLKKLFLSLFSKVYISVFRCEVCELAKSHRMSFLVTLNKSFVPFMLIHSDVWGLSPVTTMNGSRWFIAFIDDCTRMTWVCLMKSKKEVNLLFLKFHAMIQTQYKAQVQVLRSDNGREYIKSELQHYLTTQGIVHQTTCTSTPQQNGVAERKNRHLLEVVRASLIEAHMPVSCWGDALSSAAYLINRVPSSAVKFQIPFQALQDVTNAPTVPNLQPRVFWGVHHKAEVQTQTRSYDSYNYEILNYDYAGASEDVDTGVSSLDTDVDIGVNSLDTSSVEDSPVIETASLFEPLSLQHDTHNQSLVEDVPESVPNSPRRNPPRSNKGILKPVNEPELTSKAKYPMSQYVSTHPLSESNKSFVNQLSAVFIPNSVQEALADPRWKAVMNEEMKSCRRTKHGSLLISR